MQYTKYLILDTNYKVSNSEYQMQVPITKY